MAMITSDTSQIGREKKNDDTWKKWEHGLSRNGRNKLPNVWLTWRFRNEGINGEIKKESFQIFKIYQTNSFIALKLNE